MKALIAIGVILIIAAITNPKKAEHVDSVKKIIVSKSMGEAVDGLSEGSDWQKAGTAIGLTLGVKAIESMLENIISADNYVVFSLTRATLDDKTKVIGFSERLGMFGFQARFRKPEYLKMIIQRKMQSDFKIA